MRLGIHLESSVVSQAGNLAKMPAGVHTKILAEFPPYSSEIHSVFPLKINLKKISIESSRNLFSYVSLEFLQFFFKSQKFFLPTFQEKYRRSYKNFYFYNSSIDCPTNTFFNFFFLKFLNKLILEFHKEFPKKFHQDTLQTLLRELLKHSPEISSDIPA